MGKNWERLEFQRPTRVFCAFSLKQKNKTRLRYRELKWKVRKFFAKKNFALLSIYFFFGKSVVILTESFYNGIKKNVDGCHFLRMRCRILQVALNDPWPWLLLVDQKHRNISLPNATIFTLFVQCYWIEVDVNILVAF